jgi:glycosyltransferase involved in cell wall biosynthesis
MNARKILVAHKYCGFIGGIERYIFDTVLLLKKNGFTVWGIFEEELTQSSKEFKSLFDRVFFSGEVNIYNKIMDFKQEGFEHVFIHKLLNTDFFIQLQQEFTTTLFVHDHDYYCMKGHKYFSFSRKNCHRPFNTCICSVCDIPFYRDGKGKIKFRSSKPFLKRKLLSISRKCNNFIVLSDHMRDNLILNKYPLEKIIKIYPVIKLKRDFSEKGNSREILFVGQLIRGKGVDLLLKAVTHIKGDFKLNIVGKGNDEGLINHLISEYNLEDKVKMVGFTLDTGKWYNKAAVIAVPSRWQEPFGLIGGEAYSYFKPVVAFNAGGISEWLKDGKTGFLVDENDVAGFAEKIEFLLNSPKEAEKMGKAGNSLMKKVFNEKIYVDEILKITGEN